MHDFIPYTAIYASTGTFYRMVFFFNLENKVIGRVQNNESRKAGTIEFGMQPGTRKRGRVRERKQGKVNTQGMSVDTQSTSCEHCTFLKLQYVSAWSEEAGSKPLHEYNTAAEGTVALLSRA